MAFERTAFGAGVWCRTMQIPVFSHAVAHVPDEPSGCHGA
jgi:hypothetical protein